jgi:hypothetical protein
MLSDTEASCLAMALALCLRNKEKRRWMKEWLKKKRNEYTHENLLEDLRLSQLSDFQNFPRLDATSFDELLKMVTSIEKRNTTMLDATPPSQLLSITLLSIFVKQLFVLYIFYSVAVIRARDIPQSR